MTRPRISILTPCFNQAALLEQTITSVLDQHYANLEYIIIDGQSTDESVPIIKQYENKITDWFSEKNGGTADALNQGLTRCTGDIIAYLLPGQTYHPGTLEKIAAMMSGENAANWVVGQCTEYDALHQTTHPTKPKNPTRFLDYLCGENGHLPHASSFWQANLFYDYGYFALDLPYGFDYELNCRFMAYGQRATIIDSVCTQLPDIHQSKHRVHRSKVIKQRIEVAHRYELMLSIAERIKLIRNIGYRQRVHAIEQAKMRTGASLWAKIITKPWWLASSDIRQALIHPEKQAA
jgi:glycosyltransferase involved in cell wall biosynthesis